MMAMNFVAVERQNSGGGGGGDGGVGGQRYTGLMDPIKGARMRRLRRMDDVQRVMWTRTDFNSLRTASKAARSRCARWMAVKEQR